MSIGLSVVKVTVLFELTTKLELRLSTLSVTGMLLDVLHKSVITLVAPWAYQRIISVFDIVSPNPIAK